MERAINFSKKVFLHVYKDSLYKNSIYLMLSTIIMSVFGFLFWIIITKIYPADEIGVLTTVISTATLLMVLSTLGWSNGLIKYIPTSLNKGFLISTSFKIVIGFSIIITFLFIIFVDTISPALSFLKYDISYSLAFLFFVLLSSLCYIIEAVFVAQRNSGFVLLRSIIFSVLKIVFPFLLIIQSSYNLFITILISQFISVITALFVLIAKYKTNIEVKNTWYEVKKVGFFSLNIYTASLFGNIYAYILPILVINKLGPANSAYYYMVLTIIATLNIIPISTSQSLFAESSSDISNLKKKILKTLRLTYGLLIPAVLVLFLFGDKILLLFGKPYSEEGTLFLRIQSLAVLIAVLNFVAGTVLKIIDRKRLILFTSVLNTLITLIFSILFISRGLEGLGIAFIILGVFLLQKNG